jgi:hypothetical protein
MPQYFKYEFLSYATTPSSNKLLAPLVDANVDIEWPPPPATTMLTDARVDLSPFDKFASTSFFA